MQKLAVSEQLLQVPHFNFLFNDSIISHEDAGITKTNSTRPAGSSEAIINNFYNSLNSSITTKILLPHINFKFYNHNTSTKLPKEAAESVEKQVLVPFLDTRNSTSDLFNTFSSLINIPSIMIEVQGEVDQNSYSSIYKGSQISGIFKSSQISNRQWCSFFTTMDKLNNSKFNTLLWFKVQERKCFKIKGKEDRYYKRAIKIFNYQGVKLIILAHTYVNNLEDNIVYRIKDRKTKLVALDALAYLICAASLADHEIRFKLLELATKMFQSLMVTIARPDFLYRQIEITMKIILESVLSQEDMEKVEENCTKYERRDITPQQASNGMG
jgi:hypothetical protein